MATPLKLGRAWDADFHGWANQLLLGRKYRVAKSGGGASSSFTGATVPRRTPGGYPGQGGLADVKGRLAGIAGRSRQVVVKVTGGGKSPAAIRHHFDYLSRDGELEMRDQNNDPVVGPHGVRELWWEWNHAGPPVEPNETRKEAFNIVFSMPEGTDERGVYAAARSTAEHEFAGHQWVIVQHFDEPQVHAHVCVKAQGFDGQRLNPRKADLQRWRERFAYELRERGIEAEATRRIQRLQREKQNTPWAVTRLEQRGEPTHPLPAAAAPERVAAWHRDAREAEGYYDRLIGALASSDTLEDRDLGKALDRALATRKTPVDRTERTRFTEPERG